tara:strand:- start:3403 stop:4245 length:843 start_codon:yes stop_codon:yes gene_type:complete
MSDWGQGVVNNTIEWGRGSTNNTIDWGKIYADSPSGDTALKTSGAVFENVYSTEYDGVDDYVETNSTYTELDGESKITVSAWVKIDSTSDTLSYLCSTSGGSNFQLGIRLQTSTNTTCWVYVDSATNANRASASLGAIRNDGQWHHLLVCIDLSLPTFSECQIYFDSVALTTNGRYLATTLPNSTSELHIGTRASSLSSVFGGKIDEFAIWSGQDFRTQSDVDTIYNSGVPNDLNSNGLTAPTTWYRFEEGSGTTATDSGSGGNDATLINGTAYSTDVPT